MGETCLLIASSLLADRVRSKLVLDWQKSFPITISCWVCRDENSTTVYERSSLCVQVNTKLLFWHWQRWWQPILNSTTWPVRTLTVSICTLHLICMFVINLGSKGFTSTIFETFSGLGFVLLGTIRHPSWSCGSHLDSQISSFIFYQSPAAAFCLTRYCFIIRGFVLFGFASTLILEKITQFIQSFWSTHPPLPLYFVFLRFSCFRGRAL